MEISFYKVFLGFKDYILINGFHQNLPNSEQMTPFIRQICHRYTGVGGKGLILLERDSEHSAGIHYWSAEGEESAPSPEILICASRYAFDYGLVQKEEIVLQSLNGPRSLQCIDSQHFSLMIGTPTSDGEQVILPQGTVDYQIKVKTGEKTVSCTPVQFHTPIAALYMTEHQEPVSRPLQINHTIYFPIHYRVFSSEEIELSRIDFPDIDTVEAAAAVAVAAVTNGFCDRDIDISSPRVGRLLFEWNERSNSVFITGMPRYAFAGSFAYEEEEYGPAD